MKSKTIPDRHVPRIPDYLIYDEIKQRREKEAWQPDYLELPLYRPEMPAHAPREDQPDADEPRREPSSDRGVMIIDMNDLVDEDEDADDEDMTH